MYDTIRRLFCSPHKASDVYSYVKIFVDCRVHLHHPTHHRLVPLFLPDAALKFTGLDLLGLRPKTKIGNRFIVAIIDKYPKLTLTISNKKIAAAHVASTLLDAWIIPHGISHRALLKNGPQFVGKFFNAACVARSTQLMTTTACHPCTSSETYRCNKTIIDRLGHYIIETQNDWDGNVHRLAYAYNDQVHNSTYTTPFGLTFICDPPASVDIVQPTVADNTDDNSPRR